MKQAPIPAATKPDTADYAKIVESIGRISDSAKALRSAGLSREAVLVLLHHATSVPKRDIRLVLDAAEDLKSWCLAR